jgi:hypothetical protein
MPPKSSLSVPAFLCLAAPLLLATACHNTPAAAVQAKADTLSSVTKPQTDSSVAATPAVTIPQGDTTPVPKAKPRIYTVDLDGDGINDTVALTPAASDTNPFFSAITLAINGHPGQTFTVTDTTQPWTDIDDGFADADSNAAGTRQFFLRRTQSYALLLLFGYIGETGREGFSIIRIHNNEAKMVLDKASQHLPIENVDFLRDLDGDGRFELATDYTIEFDGLAHEGLDGLIGPYSPTYIFTIDDSCFLNKPLMKKYNKENYLFAGYEFSDGIKVYYPNDRSKKPRLWKK